MIGPLLMEEVDSDANRDAWGNPFSLSFGSASPSDTEASDELFVEIVSPGFDGESGTPDDIAFWTSLSGEFHEEAFSRTKRIECFLRHPAHLGR